MENARSTGLKLFSPAVNHGAGDPKFLTHFFLRGVTLHTFQHYLQFELWRITLPFVVHLIQYLSLLLCLVYQVLDSSHMPTWLNYRVFEMPVSNDNNE